MTTSRLKIWKWLFTTVIVFVDIPSFKPVRRVLTLPLYASDESASGEAAYVMADGHAYWGRLNGAADLYHMNRVEKILIPHEETISLFNFVKQRNDQLYERAIDYLVWKGVPRDSIETIPVDPFSKLSSQGEARQVVKHQPDLASIVVVTSAPHTRRSLLCFKQSVPDHWDVSVYADSPPEDNRELFEPLWMEYVKMGVHFFAV